MNRNGLNFFPTLFDDGCKGVELKRVRERCAAFYEIISDECYHLCV